MFESLRIVVAGAEKLQPQVRDEFHHKFNKQILEGYGATETTPVASVNLPDALDVNYWKVQTGGKTGSVGMPLPGTSFKIIDPQTEQELATGEEGMIIIGGAQIMQGYLNNPEKTAEVIRIIDGQRWYITGDKGRIDSDGFLTVVDRYSRFAKIGGEMLSLAAVEAQVRNAMIKIYPGLEENLELLACTVSDSKKGEAIIVLITAEVELNTIKQEMLTAGCKPLMMPAKFICVEAIPKLGSGKTDFHQAKLLAEKLSGDV